jgi:hypothetical protein
MHTPISTLKTAARDPESTTVIDLVRRLFNLHSEDETKEVAVAKSDRGPDASGSGTGVSGKPGARR